MTTHSPKPSHMPWISVYLSTNNVEAAMHFYQKAFGFKLTDEIIRNEQNEVIHAAMTYHDSLFMIGKENVTCNSSLAPARSKVQSPIGLYVYCDSVDASYQQALAAGAVSKIEPQDMHWGDRMCTVIDPDGYHWSFATHLNK